MDAMIDDVHFKLLPIVHDATEEYFSLGNCELVVALKHTQTHTQLETLRTSTQTGLSSPV